MRDKYVETAVFFVTYTMDMRSPRKVNNQTPSQLDLLSLLSTSKKISALAHGMTAVVCCSRFQNIQPKTTTVVPFDSSHIQKKVSDCHWYIAEVESKVQLFGSVLGITSQQAKWLLHG